MIFKRKRLFIGTVPMNKKYLIGTVPVNKKYLIDTVPVNKKYIIGTIYFFHSDLSSHVCFAAHTSHQ